MGKTKTALIEGKQEVKDNNADEVSAKKARGPKTRGKKFQVARKKVDRNKLYPLKEAVSLVKNTSVSSFDGTVELHLVVRKEGLTTSVELPHSTGKTKKIEVADDKTIEKLKEGKVNFDVLLATADMMPKLVPFARLLGPKGLMPNPKNGTIIKSAKDAEKFDADKLTLKTEKKAPVIHTIAGKVSMKDEQIIENVEAIFNAITTRQIQKAYLAASMGPSVKVEISN